MSGWRVRQLRAALVASVDRLGPRVVAVFLAVGLSAATFAFASVQVFGGRAQAATPNLSTVASPSTEVGRQIFDNANLMGGANPTGTITFNLHGPNDPTCSSVTFTSTVPVNGAGSYNSAPFTTSQAGTYQWTATYSGDANNDPDSTACNDPAEQVVVAKAGTVLTTTASGPVAVGGGPIFDTAHLRGGFAPTGTITFELFGPTDTFCSTAPLFTPSVPVNGNGDYVSGNFTPTQAGLYKWRARYEGDANNLGEGPTACLDPNESVLVTDGLLTPTLTTTASPSVAAGGQVFDTATLSGGLNPTGSITFALYGPDDATCSGPVAGTSNVTVTGNASYQSADITVNQPGTYRFVATYSGDLAHNAVMTACNDPAETVVVTGSTSTSSSTSTSAPTSTSIPSSTSTSTPSSTSSTSSTSTSTSTTSSTSSTSTSSTSTTSTSTTSTSTTSTTAPGGSTTSSTTTPDGSTTSSTTPDGSTTTTSAPAGSTTTMGGGSTTTTSTTATTTSTTTTVPQVPAGTTTVPGPQVGVTPQTAAAGRDVTVFGSGFPARSPLDILLFSNPVLIGSTVADGSGSFRTTVTIPADTVPGPHRLVVVVRGGTIQAETTLTVTAPAPAPALRAPVPTAAPQATLSRTGSDLSPLALAGGLLVVGLLMVGGVRLDDVRRFRARMEQFFQQPPTG